MRREALALAVSSLAWLAGCDSNAVSIREEPGGGQSARPVSARYQIDRARDRIWSLTPEGVFVHDARQPQKIALSLPGWVWANGAYGCLPDLALGPKGEAVITSNVIPTLWRVDPETLAVSAHPLALNADQEKDVGFSGLAYSSDDGAFFGISGAHGSLWRIDASLTKGEKIALSAPLRGACRVTMGVRFVPLETGRLGGLCVRTPDREWMVDLVLAGEPAYVRRMPCIDVPDDRLPTRRKLR